MKIFSMQSTKKDSMFVTFVSLGQNNSVLLGTVDVISTKFVDSAFLPILVFSVLFNLVLCRCTDVFCFNFSKECWCNL